MAKRKMDSDLEDIVMNYLMKAKCEKSAKMFGTERNHEDRKYSSKSLKKFIKYLKQSETEKENRVEDDLRGFEINFGAFQPATKLPSKENRKPLTEGTNQGPKKETEKRKKDIPKEFIKKITKLGMNVEDAQILFKSKIDWTAVYSENKIHCVEPFCKYFTKIDNDELTNHTINVHKYGDYPCNYDHCGHVASSKKSLNIHRSMHTKRSGNNFWFKCLKSNCHSTFQSEYKLNFHMRIHNNESDKCQYCPYRYVENRNYQDHLNKHFPCDDFKCDFCDLIFTTKSSLDRHTKSHEGIIYSCLICNAYDTQSKSNIRTHLGRKHSDLLGKNINWGSVKKYVKLK